jgi:hypothetical protein
MTWKDSLNNLKKVGLDGIKYLDTRHSSVTTAWGVNWDPIFIARDLMQNFYDANRDNPTSIRIEVEEDKVTISAPAKFELARLFYLGSEKGEDDIGQYGEGFKAAAVCLLRDHHIEPIAISGHQVVYIRVNDAKVDGTELEPVVYDFFHRDDPFPDTKLILRGCSKELIHALETGMTHFLFPENPLLGPVLWQSWDKLFSIYQSTTAGGHVFYRNLKRGETADIPVVLVINKSFAAIERRIQTDRDRNAFGDQLLELFYKTFARSGIKSDSKPQKALLLANTAIWPQGHALLRAAAMDNYYCSTWTPEMTKEVFGDKYFAASHTHDHILGLEYQNWEDQWKAAGRIRLPSYFRDFGVICAENHCAQIKRKAFEETKAKYHRQPTGLEQIALRVLKDALHYLAPTIMQLFQNKGTKYSVGETEALLGELRQGQNYYSNEVYLAARLFLSDFPQALAVFLHEHVHIFGHDGSRGFTDALTQLIETVVRERDKLSPIESRWEQAREAIKLQRATQLEGNIRVRIETMTDSDLRELVKALPEATLRKALNKPKTAPEAKIREAA